MIIFIILISIFLSQNNKDARMLGLGGAYTTLANGYRAIGVNPANINTGTNWTANAFSSSTSFSNNFLTIDRYNQINGAHFDNPLASSYYPKANIKNILNGEGVKLNFSSINSIPGLNFSRNNYAFTSNIIFYGDIRFPQAFVDIFFFGNEVGKELNMAFTQNSLATLETGLSYCKEFQEFNIGFTAKILQGIYYSNMEQLDNAFFKTDTTAFMGSGNYLIKQGLGGSGYGLDFGFSTKEFQNGVKIGASIINAFSSMRWNENTPFRKGLQNAGVEFPVREKEYFFFNFKVDSLNAQQLLNSTPEDMFVTDTYKVSILNSNQIPLVDLVNTAQSDLPLLFINSADESNQVYSSDEQKIDSEKILTLEDGRVIIPTDNLDDSEMQLFNAAPFKTDYPTLLRFGVSKNFYEEDILLAIDISTGLDQALSNEEKWKLSIGAEINKNPKIPIRIGTTLGGNDRYRFSLGSGYSFGKLKFDFGYAYIGSFKSSSARGADIALNLFYDYVESKENENSIFDKLKAFFLKIIEKVQPENQN